jgi:hypothetical protein
VLLMLALASALSVLETDPGALGNRYTRTASLPPAATAQVRDSGRAGRRPSLRGTGRRLVLARRDDRRRLPGDHTAFEARPLVSGHRLRGGGEAEVGRGWRARSG